MIQNTNRSRALCRSFAYLLTYLLFWQSIGGRHKCSTEHPSSFVVITAISLCIVTFTLCFLTFALYVDQQGMLEIFFKETVFSRAWTNVRALESSRAMIEIRTRIFALPKFAWFANFVLISNNSKLNKITHENNVNLTK